MIDAAVDRRTDPYFRRAMTKMRYSGISSSLSSGRSRSSRAQSSRGPSSRGSRAAGAMITAIAFDPHDRSPLHRQLYESIRGAVVSGRVAPGAKLPSTRFLSEQLNLARNTILTAFEQLLAEGYLVARTGSGTFV